MIQKKEFYFIRHGQTDHNIHDGKHKDDHPEDIALNETGRNQALAIEPIIALLPIQTICCSPMKRAQETKEIITARLEVPHHEVPLLGECTAKIWKEMAALGMYSSPPTIGVAKLFMDKVKEGINQALTMPGPSLVVAHGGVHWALCSLLGIESHPWAIDNCTLVHFSSENHGKWVAKKLS